MVCCRLLVSAADVDEMCLKSQQIAICDTISARRTAVCGLSATEGQEATHRIQSFTNDEQKSYPPSFGAFLIQKTAWTLDDLRNQLKALF